MNYDDIKDKLKPCPFCGGKEPDLIVHKKGRIKDLSIKCRCCNARSGVIAAPSWCGASEEIEDLMGYWNRRAYEEAT